MSHPLLESLPDSTLVQLYGADGVAGGRGRCAHVLEGFEKTFSAPAQALFSAPGRTEVGGNHTDHQHGHVLAAAVNLDILAAIRVTDTGVARIMSEGYPLIEVDLNRLEPVEAEKNTTAALVRGVAARMKALGCNWGNAGLEAYMTTTVPGGSGLSSSAAFEVLMGTIFNDLFFNKKLTPVEIAQVGQYAENVFFGKPCGLMDQSASSVGGVVAIDFGDPAHPVVEQVVVDLQAQGYALCILDSGADHADLTGEYAAITLELKAVSHVFGKEVLRDIPEEEFLAHIPEARKAAGDRGVLRAIHFYADDRRAAQEAQALRDGDFDRFLTLIRESGQSSAMYLQNVVPTGATTQQALMITLAVAQRTLNGRGAVRVHGGGFGGTAQAFVPLDLLDHFKTTMEAVLGPNTCHVVSFRPVGGFRLA